MTRVAICFSVLLLLLAASVGASEVTNIELNKVGGITTARIDIDGKVRFTHQTEEAKDGRPFRVIVDILSAIHELGAKEFSGLPDCLIEGIRTSQFSAKPEQVVRIVFDMKSSPIYRVESENNSISVFFTDQSGPDFGPWSSTAFVKKTQPKVAPKRPESTPPTIAQVHKEAPKSAKSQNEAIAGDRLASLAGPSKTVPKTADKPNISEASVQRAAKVNVPPKPEIESNLTSLAEPPAVQSKQTAQTKSKSATEARKKIVSKQVHSQWAAQPAPSTTAAKKSLAVASTPKVTKKVDAKPIAKKKPSSGVTAKFIVKVGTGPLQGPPPPPTPKAAKPKIASKDTQVKPKATVAKAKSTPNKKAGTKEVAHQKAQSSSTKKVVAKKTQSSSTKKVVAKKTQSSSTKKVVAKKTQSSSTKKVVAKKTQSSSTKKVAAKKNTQPVRTKKVAKTPKVKKTTVASMTKDSKPASNEKSTSRFRRKPVVSRKIKGTLVAEFPRRLTIKYRARSSHDPFETLINENRRYNEPIDKQVPNVEGLRLVGVIESENGKNSALFEDKDGYGYILQSGDKVRKGYVLRVENDRVYFQIFEYGWSRTMALKMDEY